MDKKRFNERSKRFLYGQQPVKMQPRMLLKDYLNEKGTVK